MENSKTMKKGLLLFPPIKEYAFNEEWKSSESLTPPLGLLYLATPLINKGYHITFIDLTVDKLEKEEFLDIIRDQDFILITCFLQTINNIKKIIKDIRTVNPEANIICGGQYFKKIPEYIEDSNINVIGEAEQHITTILDLISQGKSLDSIPGLIYKQNEKIFKTKGYMKIENLDLSSLPYLELGKDKSYGEIQDITIKNLAPILTTRGCPFKCTFCDYGTIKYRERSIENVLDEIKLREKQGYKYLIICDANFLANKHRANEIAEKIIKNKIKIKILCSGRVDFADYHLYKKLKKAGLIVLFLGIESVNQEVLDFYNKGTDLKQMKNAISIINKIGIISIGSLIVGAPMETNKHFEDTKKVLNNLPLDFLSIKILQYNYGTKIWEDANKKGLIKKNELSILANEKLSNFSSDELIEISQDIINSFYKHPYRISRSIYKIIRLNETRLILKFLKAHINKSFLNFGTDFSVQKETIIKNGT